MLTALLEALLCLWHLCTWRQLGGVVVFSFNALWQQWLFWGQHVFIETPTSPPSIVLFPHPIKVHRRYEDKACWQNKANSDNICIRISLEIILVCNIISQNSFCYVLWCNQSITECIWSHCHVFRIYADARSHAHKAPIQLHSTTQSTNCTNIWWMCFHAQDWSHPSAICTAKVTCHASWRC